MAMIDCEGDGGGTSDMASMMCPLSSANLCDSHVTCYKSPIRTTLQSRCNSVLPIWRIKYLLGT